MAWDWEQMFTPPKSKSPWTAMTHGSSGEWARDVEPWGQVIMAGLSKVPYVGPALGAAGGAAGMGGRGTGYIGSDYGDANYGTTIGGAVKGLYGGDMKSAAGSALQGTLSSVLDENDDEHGVNPEANKYNSSWYGGVISGIGGLGGSIGSSYGKQGSKVGGDVGSGLNIFRAGDNYDRAEQGDLSGFGGMDASKMNIPMGMSGNAGTAIMSSQNVTTSGEEEDWWDQTIIQMMHENEQWGDTGR